MANPIVVFTTSQGSFEVELYADKTPATVQNFVQYVSDKHYDGTIFHRVIDGFMIQGGGFGADGKQKPTRAPIKNESGKGPKNCNYGIAMARTSDLNSATAQFYINVADNAFLDDGQYCAFGKVTQGTQTIDKIKKVAVDKPGRLSEAQPKTPVVIESATVKPQ
ncbi:MAG: peptidylprolyl isomerase [Planctomycetota bacterium]|nr:peptidylprolyl isomerase [Planctomycetota bacterium]